MKAISEIQGLEVISRTEESYKIQITHTLRGKLLNVPIEAEIPCPSSNKEQALYVWLIQALSRMNKLVPFAFANQTILNMADSFFSSQSPSKRTAFNYIYATSRFCRWLNKTPDEWLRGCWLPNGTPNNQALYEHSKLLNDFAVELRDAKLAEGYITNYAKAIKALHERNNLPFTYLRRFSAKRKYRDRAPTPDELTRLLDMAALREKVILSWLALGGFREGTLTLLTYGDVKEDLERGIIPIHVYVPAEKTKGRYHDFDSFVGKEGVDFLNAYLDARRRGTKDIPPEEINDDSPLIRNYNFADVKPVTTGAIYDIIHRLYLRAGLTEKVGGRMYKVRVHSIRKFFRTQMAALGVPADYIEYMMGHTVSTYHDIQMKGIEFLRGIYISSGLSIRPKTKFSKIDALKEIIRAWGMNPEELLTKRALVTPHRTVVSPQNAEQNQIIELSEALRDIMRKELLPANNGT